MQAPTSGDADSEAGLEAVTGLVMDEAVLPLQAACNPAATCSFHIAYSASYGVPMLLFDAREPGAPAALCDSRHAVLQAACVVRLHFISVLRICAAPEQLPSPGVVSRSAPLCEKPLRFAACSGHAERACDSEGMRLSRGCFDGSVCTRWRAAGLATAAGAPTRRFPGARNLGDHPLDLHHTGKGVRHISRHLQQPCTFKMQPCAHGCEGMTADVVQPEDAKRCLCMRWQPQAAQHQTKRLCWHPSTSTVSALLLFQRCF